jgi:hypothetical protein
MIVRFVDIGGIVDQYCLNSLFIELVSDCCLTPTQQFFILSVMASLFIVLCQKLIEFSKLPHTMFIHIKTHCNAYRKSVACGNIYYVQTFISVSSKIVG